MRNLIAEGTEDKVYLLSSGDLMNADFGFNASLSEYDEVRKLMIAAGMERKKK